MLLGVLFCWCHHAQALKGLQAPQARRVLMVLTELKVLLVLKVSLEWINSLQQ